MTVPVVGALLIFSLMIGPPAAARCFTNRTGLAMIGSVVIALITIWASIAAAYQTNWPVGFFVGVISALWFGIGRAFVAVSTRAKAPSGYAVRQSEPAAT
jgi:zinc/manganese transport system permease protein